MWKEFNDFGFIIILFKKVILLRIKFIIKSIKTLFNIIFIHKNSSIKLVISWWTYIFKIYIKQFFIIKIYYIIFFIKGVLFLLSHKLVWYYFILKIIFIEKMVFIYNINRILLSIFIFIFLSTNFLLLFLDIFSYYVYFLNLTLFVFLSIFGLLFCKYFYYISKKVFIKNFLIFILIFFFYCVLCWLYFFFIYDGNELIFYGCSCKERGEHTFKPSLEDNDFYRECYLKVFINELKNSKDAYEFVTKYMFRDFNFGKNFPYKQEDVSYGPFIMYLCQGEFGLYIPRGLIDVHDLRDIKVLIEVITDEKLEDIIENEKKELLILFNEKLKEAGYVKKFYDPKSLDTKRTFTSEESKRFSEMWVDFFNKYEYYIRNNVRIYIRRKIQSSIMSCLEVNRKASESTDIGYLEFFTYSDVKKPYVISFRYYTIKNYFYVMKCIYFNNLDSYQINFLKNCLSDFVYFDYKNFKFVTSKWEEPLLSDIPVYVNKIGWDLNYHNTVSCIEEMIEDQCKDEIIRYKSGDKIKVVEEMKKNRINECNKLWKRDNEVINLVNKISKDKFRDF